LQADFDLYTTVADLEAYEYDLKAEAVQVL
jgi:hypothetical protein